MHFKNLVIIKIVGEKIIFEKEMKKRVRRRKGRKNVTIEEEKLRRERKKRKQGVKSKIYVCSSIHGTR